MLGFEVYKPSKTFIKATNAMKYIELSIQNSEAQESRVVYNPYLPGLFERVLEVVQVSSLYQYPHVWTSSSMLLIKREREERGEFSKGFHGHF